MSTEACNACGALCDEDQFNREGLGYCAQCFAESGPAGAIAVIAESVSLLRAVDSAEGSFLDRKADHLEKVGDDVAEFLAAEKELEEANAAWERLTGSRRSEPGPEYQRARAADARRRAAFARLKGGAA